MQVSGLTCINPPSKRKSSFLALGIMSYDRFISVVYPLTYNIIMTASRIKLCIILTWLIVGFILTIQCTLFLHTASALEKMVRSYLLAAFSVTGSITLTTGFLLGIFSGGAESIVMQISFVMLLFSDQISGRGKSFLGGTNCLRGAPLPPPLWKKARS